MSLHNVQAKPLPLFHFYFYSLLFVLFCSTLHVQDIAHFIDMILCLFFEL